MPSHNHHAFAAYNKTQATPTLVGNWYEERCLQDSTGLNRYKTWVSNEEQTTVYAPKQDSAADMPTKPRVVEHSNQLLPAEWKAQSHVSYQDPAQRNVQGFMRYTESQLGPREQMELRALQQVAQDLPQPPPLPPQFDTINRTSYVTHDLSGVTVGTRVMKTPDLGPIQRDPTFLAEANITKKPLADRIMKGAVSLNTARLPDPDAALTIYSEAAAKGVYGGTVYGSKAAGITPFGRYTNFTKDMGDFSKIVDDE